MRRGKIECPRGTEPAIIERAKMKHQEFLAEIRRTGRDRRVRRPKKGDSDEPNGAKKQKREAVLTLAPDSASTASTASSMSSSTGSAAQRGPTVFMYSAVVLSVAPPSRRILPVPIQAAFPHITLQLGSALGCENCPAVRCVVDTAAALSTGNLHFFTALAKAYPHTVASIHSSSDYSPITLSGIVQNEGAPMTTDLSVAFRFHLPYLTREGSPTSFLIACGRDVTVNAILGLPFIQQTRMVIDAADMVAELKALDTPPFDIEFRHAMCAVPPVDPARARANAAFYADIIREVENIEQFFCSSPPSATPASILQPAKRARRVGFSDESSSAASPAMIGHAIDLGMSHSYDADDAISVCDTTTSA